MSEKQEGQLYKEIGGLPQTKWEPCPEFHRPYVDTLLIAKVLDEAKAEAPTPEKILQIASQRLGRIPEGGLGKAVLDCIESAEWREWFTKYFGEPQK